jgi:hypothetical protein
LDWIYLEQILMKIFSVNQVLEKYASFHRYPPMALRNYPARIAKHKVSGTRAGITAIHRVGIGRSPDEQLWTLH